MQESKILLFVLIILIVCFFLLTQPSESISPETKPSPKSLFILLKEIFFLGVPSEEIIGLILEMTNRMERKTKRVILTHTVEIA